MTNKTHRRTASRDAGISISPTSASLRASLRLQQPKLRSSSSISCCSPTGGLFDFTPLFVDSESVEKHHANIMDMDSCFTALKDHHDLEDNSSCDSETGTKKRRSNLLPLYHSSNHSLFAMASLFVILFAATTFLRERDIIFQQESSSKPILTNKLIRASGVEQKTVKTTSYSSRTLQQNQQPQEIQQQNQQPQPQQFRMGNVLVAITTTRDSLLQKNQYSNILEAAKRNPKIQVKHFVGPKTQVKDYDGALQSRAKHAGITSLSIRHYKDTIEGNSVVDTDLQKDINDFSSVDRLASWILELSTTTASTSNNNNDWIYIVPGDAAVPLTADRLTQLVSAATASMIAATTPAAAGSSSSSSRPKRPRSNKRPHVLFGPAAATVNNNNVNSTTSALCQGQASDGYLLTRATLLDLAAAGIHRCMMMQDPQTFLTECAALILQTNCVPLTTTTTQATSSA